MCAGLPGGVRLSLQGQGFGSSCELVNVTVGGQPCTVVNAQSNLVTCITGVSSSLASGPAAVQVCFLECSSAPEAAMVPQTP